MIYIIAVYAVIALIFFVWSMFALYHSFAFGFKGDKTRPIAIAFIVFFLSTVGAQVYLLFAIPWFDLI